MPDWSYLPLFRPLLDRFGSRGGRAIALRAMGTLARLPFGAPFVELFGDLEPEPRSHIRIAGLGLASAIGIGAGLDVAFTGARALGRLGVGFCEIGPVTREPVAGGAVTRDDALMTICYDEPLENAGLAVAARVPLERRGRARAGFRLAHARGAMPEAALDETLASHDALAGRAAFFTLDLRAALDDAWPREAGERHVAAFGAALRERHGAAPWFLAIPPDGDEATSLALAQLALAGGAAGVTVGGGTAVVGHARRRIVGAATHAASLARVRALRARLGAAAVVVGSGGIASPAEALAFFEAGADLVQVHSGLVFAGPALPRRIGDALLARKLHAAAGAASDAATGVVPRRRWAWGLAYALALCFTALLVFAVGVTRVVLPYDEIYAGMTRARIAGFDPRLLPFMTHDRVTAAGTLLALGMLYAGLAAFGIRRGERWAWRAIFASSLPGFLSYWLWLRLGYFEPLHALATLALLPFFLATFFTSMPSAPERLVDRNDRAWRRSLVAQLLFVVVGSGLAIGGVTISVVGVTSIFVQTDLSYLRTTPAAIETASPHLVPLVAHDRAEFGGALAAYGVVLLLTTLWGFRRGERWLWWTLLLSAIPGFAFTLAVHAAIGYTDFWHLAPVNFALVLTATALALARPYLCERPASSRSAVPRSQRASYDVSIAAERNEARALETDGPDEVGDRDG